MVVVPSACFIVTGTFISYEADNHIAIVGNIGVGWAITNKSSHPYARVGHNSSGTADPSTFGQWAAATTGSSTMVTADGLLVVRLAADGGAGEGGILIIRTDGANPPTTARCIDMASYAFEWYANCTVPVKSEDYYLIQLIGAAGGVNLTDDVFAYWIPYH